MKAFRLTFLLPALWLSLGCGSEPEPAPPLDAERQAEIEREDAAIEAEESQQQ